MLSGAGSEITSLFKGAATQRVPGACKIMNSNVAAFVDHQALESRFQEKAAIIGIIGLGYVGLPLARAAVNAGYSVVGFDIDDCKIRSLLEGRSYIHHIPDNIISGMLGGGKFKATSDFSAISEVDAVLICVPTPLTRHREPDMSFVVSTTENICPHLKPGHLIVLESTTYPGTTSDLLSPILEKSGLRRGHDLFVAYSPEREDPGNPSFDTVLIPKLVGADDPVSLRLAKSLYERIVVSVMPVSSASTAEAAKLTENIFRSINIALVNELKTIFDSMNIDVWEVIEAAKSKPFGYMPFYPGPGLGGHCIPIDPFYLSWKAREYDVAARFIELAGEINTAMPNYVIQRLTEAVDQVLGRGLRGSRILVIGIAYKKNVDDVRESPSFKLMHLLEERGAIVSYHDPYVPEIPVTREHPAFAGRKSLPLTADTLAGFEAVLIVTDHDCIDFPLIVQAGRVVVDTRNATGTARRDLPHVFGA